ncbi:hypothetical protein QYM36_013161 [Artemia franciscana]|uniref:Uncharacterized protein n=1 Tax=Artemia franciscana TaxID=6661 RepID=A0AA88HDJ7_ARTSF|nr:hypothetical protein QYM36_013161 [Artemia franciscana]
MGSTETENSCEKEVDKRTPELNVRDRCISTQFLDINSGNTRKKSDILSDTLLEEIKDRALSKGSSVKDLSISAREQTIAPELPSLVCDRSSIELVSTVQKKVSPTPFQKDIDSDDFTGSRSSIYESEPSSKKRKVSNGGPIRTMPNLIAISEIPTPLVARSVQTLAGSRKPDVRIVEAVRNNEPEKLSLKDGDNSPQSSAVILDLSEKKSSAKSLSCNAPEKKISPSTTLMPNVPKIPAVTIKERGIAPKSTSMNPINKESYQHEQASLLPRGNAPVQSFNTMSNPHPNSIQNHILQSMALAQTQHMQQLQAAMYAASAAKQASGTTSPLVNPVEFQRVRNILTWNALAHIQGHRPPTSSFKESPRLSSRLPCDRSEDFVTSQASNVIKPKAKYNKSNNDSVRGNLRQFVELQQNERVTPTSNPRLSLNSSVREIPNPSLLQQRRLTQLLNVNTPENIIAGRKSDIPSPKRVMENKLAANKELTVNIVSSGNKLRKS